MSTHPTLRYARPADVPTILSFFKDAAVEQAPGASVEATEAGLNALLHLDAPSPEAEGTGPPAGSRGPRFVWPLLVVAPDGKVAGHAIYYYNFSSWLGSLGLHLEELYVLPEYRRMGYAKYLIDALAREAEKAGCSKMEWLCYKDNERALRFYGRLGAERVDNLVTLKVGKDGIGGLAATPGPSPATEADANSS